MIQEVSMTRIVLDPGNPRKKTEETGIKELADSINSQGLLSHIIVRLIDGKYKIVCGERRFKACQLLGHDFIKAEIRELTDAEALQCALSENMNREDMHPMEEAEAFVRLIDEHAMTPEDIAHKFGKSTTFVYKRIRLRDLCDRAKILFLMNVLTITHCMELIKISEKDQERILDVIIDTEEDDPNKTIEYVTHTPKEIRSWIKNNIEVRLNTAPFKLTDPKLIPEMGPCTSCQFRSGFNKTLFNDVLEDDICFNPECYKKKTNAHFEGVKAKFSKKGGKVAEISTERYVRPRDMPNPSVIGSAHYHIVPEDHKCNQPEKCTAIGVVVHGTNLGTHKSISIIGGDDHDEDCPCLDTLYYDDDKEEYTKDFPVEDPKKSAKKVSQKFVSSLLGDDDNSEETEEEEENTDTKTEEETPAEKEEFRLECFEKYSQLKSAEVLEVKLSSGVLPGLTNNKMLDLIIAMYSRQMDTDDFCKVIKPFLDPDKFTEIEEKGEGDYNAKVLLDHLSSSDSPQQRCEILMKMVIADSLNQAGITWYDRDVKSGEAPDLSKLVNEIFEINDVVSEKDFKLIWDKFETIPQGIFDIVDKDDFFDFILKGSSRHIDIDSFEEICEEFEIEKPENSDDSDEYLKKISETVREHFAI